MQTEAFFLSVGDGQRFAVAYAPPHGVTAKGCVLCAPPFAEEMNKSRRMMALQARSFAKVGYLVLHLDPFGCGDSSGDFGDATWDAWLGDMELGRDWLSQRSDAPIWYWGVRAGALLATEFANQHAAPDGFLFWQPVLSGKHYLGQWLRLGVAGDILASRAESGTASARKRLSAGEPVEVGGYLLSPRLCSRMEAAELLPPSATTEVRWMELVSRTDMGSSAGMQTAVARWADAGHSVRLETVSGPAFWQTVEITEVPELIAKTTSALGGRAT